MTGNSDRVLIKFRVVGGSAAKDVVDREGYAVDIGEESLVLLSKRPFPDAAELELKLPGRTARGVVKGAGEPDDAGDYRIGITLIAPEPEGIALFSDEKRRYPRKPCKHFVRYKCVSKSASLDHEPRSGVITELSKGGVRMKLVRDYVMGAILEIQMPEGILGPKKATLYARVCWRMRGEKDGEIILGAMFVRLSEPPPPEGV